MIAFQNTYLIGVPEIYDETASHGIKKMNVAHFIEKERDRYERKIRIGVVVSQPLGYTNVGHMPIDPGIPRHRLYIGHDDIQMMVGKGYNWNEKYYHPGMKERLEFIKKSDYGRRLDAVEGEVVYFHPSVTEPENYQGQHEGMKLYRCDVHELIFCNARAQGFWALVEPIGEETARGEFQVEGEDRLLEGKVKFIHPASSIKAGDHIFFQEDSNWEFEIDGVRYFCMEEENIVMKKINLTN